MSSKKSREQVSARLDPEVFEAVRRVAEAERRPVSNLVRNVLADWVRSRAQQPDQERAA